MNNEEQLVLDYLEENAQGEANKKTSDEIQRALSLPTGGRTNEYTREIIRSLIINHNAVIGSDSRGYWIIQNEEELQNVIGSLNSRAQEIQERATALQRNWRNRNNG